MFTVASAADFASSLSLLAILVWATSRLRRRLPDEAVGLLFGLVALLQMHAPIDMAPGVIVDLRCVTVGIAATLLRPGGAIACVAVAVAARLQIGGVGAPAGVGAILLSATAAGYYSAEMARRTLRPQLPALIGLALAVSSHVLSAALLPGPIALDFLADIAPVLVGVNLLAIPALAWIGLQDPRAKMGQDGWIDPRSGTLSPTGLRGAWAHRRAADLPSRGTGLTMLRLRHERWTTRTFGGATLDTAMGALRARLDAVLPREAIIARLGPATLAIVWPDIDEVGHRAASMGLVRASAERAVLVEEGYRLGIPVRSGLAWRRLDADLDDLLAAAEAELRASTSAGARPRPLAA